MNENEQLSSFLIELKDPKLIEEKKALFQKPVVPIKVTDNTRVVDLLDSYQNAGFQSRALGDCAGIFDRMLRDPDRPTIFLGLAGSLIAAGMRQVIVDLIDNNMIDVLVSTGAIIGQDHYQVLGGQHYQGSPNLDDKRLRDLYVDRLYDVMMCEEKYWKADKYICEFSSKFSGQTLSSRQFLEALGNEKAVNDPKSILGACVRNNVPVFVPALNDSSIGIGITDHYQIMKLQNRKPMTISSIQDNYELTELVHQSPCTSAIYISGGVPKNYINDSVVMTYIFGKDTGGHRYAVQLTMTGPQDGGLSGSTLSEATSWGKVSKKANHRMAYVETSIGLPLLYGYALQKGSAKERTKLSPKWDGDLLTALV
jgi:deoxyhypusine synthase